VTLVEGSQAMVEAVAISADDNFGALATSPSRSPHQTGAVHVVLSRCLLSFDSRGTSSNAIHFLDPSEEIIDANQKSEIRTPGPASSSRRIEQAIRCSYLRLPCLPRCHLKIYLEYLRLYWPSWIQGFSPTGQRWLACSSLTQFDFFGGERA